MDSGFGSGFSIFDFTRDFSHRRLSCEMSVRDVLVDGWTVAVEDGSPEIDVSDGSSVESVQVMLEDRSHSRGEYLPVEIRILCRFAQKWRDHYAYEEPRNLLHCREEQLS